MDSLDWCSSSALTATTISDVNDYCLREVFKHLDVEDLCTIVDVSERFRQNAKAYFACSEHRDSYIYHNFGDCSTDEKMTGLTKYFRHFGKYLKSIQMLGSEEANARYQRRECELLSTYCSDGALIDMDLRQYDISDEIALIIRPALAGLRTLRIVSCKWGDLFLHKLPAWSPELRKLELMEQDGRRCGWTMQFDGLHQSYEKLTKVFFFNVNGIQNNTIDEFLKRNPQLKEIKFPYCSSLDGSILQSIAVHMPQVETLQFEQSRAPDAGYIQYFGQLTHLSALQIALPDLVTDTHLTRIICEMSAAKIPLKSLEIPSAAFGSTAAQFVEGISQFKTLKRLVVGNIRGLDAADFRYICKELPELDELRIIGTRIYLNPDNLLRLIQSCEKLHTIYFVKRHTRDRPESYCIGTSTFMKMVEIVQRRREKMHLLVELNTHAYTVDVPKDLTKKYKDILTLSLPGWGNP